MVAGKTALSFLIIVAATITVAALTFSYSSSAQPAQTFSKSDYLTLVKSEVSITSACSYYDSNFAETASPAEISAATKSIEWVNKNFVNGEGWWEALTDYAEYEPIFESVEKCSETTTIIDNLTGETSTETSCWNESIQAGTVQVAKQSWQPYNWDRNAFHLRFCANLIAVTGTRSIDHIPSIAGYSYPEYTWWNTSCNTTFQLTITNNNATTALAANTPIVINFNHMGNLTAGYFNSEAGNDLYIVYQDTTELNRVPDAYSSFNSTNSMIAFPLQAAIAGGATDSTNYRIYGGCTEMTAPKSNVTAVFTAMQYVDEFYPFEGNANTYAPAQATNLTLMGNIHYNSTVYKLGRSAYFDGVDDYFTHPTYLDDANTRFSVTGISIELWSNNDNGTGEDTMIFKYNQNPTQHQICLETDNVTYVGDEKAGGAQNLVTQKPVLHDQWQHIVLVWKGDGSEYLYVDGNQSLRKDITGVFWSNAGTGATDVFIGVNPTIANDYIGFMDDFTIWKRSLSLAEVSTLRSRGTEYPTFTWLNPAPSVTVGSPQDREFANDEEGRSAIEAGINGALGNSTQIKTGRQEYVRYDADTPIQNASAFDKVVSYGNQTWVFNYLAGSDQPSGMLNMTPVFYVWEKTNMTSNSITSEVSAFITATKQT